MAGVCTLFAARPDQRYNSWQRLGVAFSAAAATLVKVHPILSVPSCARRYSWKPLFALVTDDSLTVFVDICIKA